MSYGKVHDAYWDSERIASLSDRAALLGLFLITGDHRNAIGCFRLGVGAITDIDRFGEWGIEGVLGALSEMAGCGFIVRDDRSGWTLITKHLEKDPIKGPKAAIHALSLLERVPQNSAVYQPLVARLLPQLQENDKALQGKPGWPIKGVSVPKRSPEPSPEPEPIPVPSPVGEGPPADEVSDGRAKRKQSRGSRLAEGWEPDADGLAFAAERGLEGQRLADEIEKFRNHWLAKPGRDGTKLDWGATWRNWCIRAAEYAPVVHRPGSGAQRGAGLSPHEQLARSADRALAVRSEMRRRVAEGDVGAGGGPAGSEAAEPVEDVLRPLPAPEGGRGDGSGGSERLARRSGGFPAVRNSGGVEDEPEESGSVAPADFGGGEVGGGVQPKLQAADGDAVDDPF